jgi:ADP-heptose:LPS heptosyltransferase
LTVLRSDRQREVSRILFLILLPIGDTLFITPTIRAIRERYPRAHLTALVYPSNAGILENNPDIDELLVHPTLQDWRGWPYFLQMFRKIIWGRYDLAVQCCTTITWLTLVARIPRRAKMNYPRLWWLLPNRGRAWRQTHAVQHYADIVRPLGVPVTDYRPSMYVSYDDRMRAADFLRSHGLAPWETLVAIHPGGEGFYGRKRWNREGFAKVADRLAREQGVKTIILGGPREKELTSAVAGLMETETIDAAGLTTLRETAALAEHCALFIGNDSSPLHIAAAMGTSVVGIYGPSNPLNYHPYPASGGPQSNCAVIRGYARCGPCVHLVGGRPLWRVPLCRTCKALATIEVEDVFDAAVEALSQASSRTAGVVEPAPLALTR